MKKTCFSRRPHGFTLIELLVVTALMALLLSVAVPSFAGLLETSRLRALTNDLLGDLQLTRTEAILRGQRVVLCVASGEGSCSAERGWQRGWLMFVDENNNGVRDAAELVLRYRAAAPDGWVIAGNQPVSRYVSYDGLGTTRLVSGGFQAGTLTICREGTALLKGRKVVINSLGRPRSQEINVTQCV